MTILITGGAGFIGSHLCEKLLKNGHRVFCLDNLFTGRKRNIKHLCQNKKFTFIEQDIIEPFFIKEKISQIYNLACPASPVHYQANSIRTIKANTIGMINILDLARKHKARILQASTSEVYGDPKEYPQKEIYFGNVNCFGERSCYDEGKRVAESLMYCYQKQHKLDIRIVRIFNTYGPRMQPDDGRVISNFIVQALRGEPLTVYGQGGQTRSFCFISDLIDGLTKLMASDYSKPINLGNSKEFTIKELANLILHLTGSKSKMVYKSLPQDDPKQRQPDILLARGILSWEPKVSLEQGLKKTID